LALNYCEISFDLLEAPAGIPGRIVVSKQKNQFALAVGLSQLGDKPQLCGSSLRPHS